MGIAPVESRRASGSVRRSLAGVSAALLIATVACSSEPAASVDPASYRTDLTAICAETSEQRAAVVDPTDAATTVAFAQQVATVLTTEADAARALRPPAELDDDHRAFVQNTDDQARQWLVLAGTPIDDAAAFGEVQTAILELTLGRDDLAVDMGVDGCRVATAPGS